MPTPELISEPIRTHYGCFCLFASEKGIRKLKFPSKNRAQNIAPVKSLKAKKILLEAKKVLSDYFSGKKTDFDKIKIDWTIFGSFERKVLNTLMKVEMGRTVSYADLARRAQFQNAARAVGNCLNKNPIPILIPCHRVVRKDSSLGGYGAGIRWKRILLDLERKTMARTF